MMMMSEIDWWLTLGITPDDLKTLIFGVLYISGIVCPIIAWAKA